MHCASSLLYPNPPRFAESHDTEGPLERPKTREHLPLETLRLCLPSVTGMPLDPLLEANREANRLTNTNVSQLEPQEAIELHNEAHREPIRQYHDPTAPCPYHL